MRTFLIAAAVASVALAAQPAFATPITAGSTFNIQGSSVFDATTITFASPASTLGPNTGDFATFAPCLGCVTMTTPLTYAPFTPGLVYTATNGGITTSFDALSSVSVHDYGTSLVIDDKGTLTLTGFDATPGELVVTANEFGTSGSFSATHIARTPEPTAMVVLGIGLLGLAAVGRRRDAMAK